MNFTRAALQPFNLSPAAWRLLFIKKDCTSGPNIYVPTLKADVLHKVVCLFWFFFPCFFALDWMLLLQWLPAKRFSDCTFKKTKTGLWAKPAVFIVFLYDSILIMFPNCVECVLEQKAGWILMKR